MNRTAPVLVLLLVGCASGTSSPSTPPPPGPSTSTPPPVASADAADAGSAQASDAPDAAPPPAAIVYPTAPDDSDALILRRGACNGQCPIYTVGITSNGNVHFYGEMFTTTAGYAFGKITPEQVAALYKFMSAHPVSAAVKNGVRRPDSATAYVVVHRNGSVKKLNPPGEIAGEIDRVVGITQWTGNGSARMEPSAPLPQPAFEAMLGRQLRALDKCATAKTEIKLGLHITAEGRGQSASAGGKKESDSACIGKVVGSFLFPLADVNVAELTLAIGK